MHANRHETPAASARPASRRAGARVIGPALLVSYRRVGARVLRDPSAPETSPRHWLGRRA